MAWIEKPPRPDDDRPGCMDAIVLTRVAFGILFWPMAAVLGAAAGVAIAILLLASYPLPTLIAAGVVAVAGVAAWRVVSARRRPPEG